MQKYLRHCTVFWHKWPVHDLVLVIPPPPLIKVASNTRPYSKLGGTTLNGREEGGQYYILQTCDQERFETRKVVFPWECLIIFATGCSRLKQSGLTMTIFGVSVRFNGTRNLACVASISVRVSGERWDESKRKKE